MFLSKKDEDQKDEGNYCCFILLMNHLHSHEWSEVGGESKNSVQLSRKWLEKKEKSNWWEKYWCTEKLFGFIWPKEKLKLKKI